MRILDAIAKASRMNGPNDDLCCVFARNVMLHAYGEAFVNSEPILKWHLSPEWGAWAPVDAVVGSGIGERVTEPKAGQWHFVQGWRGTPLAKGVSGHTFLWSEFYESSSGIKVDSVKGRPGYDRIRGPNSWNGVVSEFKGGLSIAVLRIPEFSTDSP